MSTDSMIQELKKMKREGIKIIKIYYAEDMSEIENNMWSVDVMNNRLNSACHMAWTWTVMSAKENEACCEFFEDDSPLADYEIVIHNELFSDEVICRAITSWLVYADLEYLGFEVKMIDFDAAAPHSGYVAELMSRDIEEELAMAVPLEDLSDL